MIDKRIISANIHITDACNYRCCFCFSRNNNERHRELGLSDWKYRFRDLIINHGIKKINFAGGEPLLYPELKECMRFCKQLGACVGIISNGSLITEDFLNDTKNYLDWIGLSLDSTSEGIEIGLGRCNGSINHIENVIKVSDLAQVYGFHVKLNITVTNRSCKDDFRDLIQRIEPERVKFLQVSNVKGINDNGYDSTKLSSKDFSRFVCNHSDIVLSNGTKPVFETSEIMNDSYFMLNSKGDVRVVTPNGYAYVDYDRFWTDKYIEVNVNNYLRRNAIYEW